MRTLEDQEKWDAGWCPPCITGSHDCHDAEYAERRCACDDPDCIEWRADAWPDDEPSPEDTDEPSDRAIARSIPNPGPTTSQLMLDSIRNGD